MISAKGRVDNAKIRLKNAQISYSRNKALYEKQVLAAQDFENIELTYQQAQQELINAENDYQILKAVRLEQVALPILILERKFLEPS